MKCILIPLISPGYYRYYQLNVSANNGDTFYLAVGELELIEVDALYYFSGYITEKDAPVSRKVSVYDRVTGGFESTTTSSGSKWVLLSGDYFKWHTFIVSLMMMRVKIIML